MLCSECAATICSMNVLWISASFGISLLEMCYCHLKKIAVVLCKCKVLNLSYLVQSRFHC